MTRPEPPAEDQRQLDELAVMLRRAAERDRAPAGLRRRIEMEQRSRARPAPRRRLALGGGLATALAAAALLIALVLPGGTPGAPTVAQAAALALRGADTGAPPADPAAPRLRLSQQVGEVYFPSWASTLRWRAVGRREDHLGGRAAVTVFYRRGTDQIAYTILGLPALRQPAVRSITFGGVSVRALRLNGRTVITWRRGGQTCIISTRTAPLHDLQVLAAWHAAASLA